MITSYTEGGGTRVQSPKSRTKPYSKVHVILQAYGSDSTFSARLVQMMFCLLLFFLLFSSKTSASPYSHRQVIVMYRTYFEGPFLPEPTFALDLAGSPFPGRRNCPLLFCPTAAGTFKSSTPRTVAMICNRRYRHSVLDQDKCLKLAV